MSPLASDPYGVLKQYFGYEEFRLGQREVIEAILEKRDALAIMPTGAGKSLCFQVPALLMEGISLVISPLISLMQDQVNALRQSGIAAAFINSSLTASQTQKALANAQGGAYKIIYVAPERLETAPFLNFAAKANISMIAVDEAHCVSHWGQDFRPSYLQISSFVSDLPRRPILSAFTATATDLVKDDIIKLLDLQEPLIRSTGFNRENLYFEVRHPKSKFDELAEYLTENKGKSGIIYCATRKTVDDVASQLNSINIKVARYHAGMPQAERSAGQQDFLYERVPIIVATNAFGMGIDKSNVHFVLHYNMPKNIENYYQEAGRAGRDGSPAECIMLFAQQDLVINRMLIDNSESSEETRALDYRRLREIEEYCTTTDCLRQYILDYFRDTGSHDCNNCSNCRTERKMTDITIDAQKILSCVYRMKGRFGIALVIEVLQGKYSQRIKELRLDELKTYGIMGGQSTEEIREMAYFLLRKAYMQIVGDRYPVVQITEKANEILRQGQSIEMPQLPFSVRQNQSSGKKQKPKHSAKPKAQYSVDKRLFEGLRALRLKLAEEAKAPAFTIFSDASLYDMCSKLPTDDESFLNVSGVGAVKLQKYGSAFIELIKNHLSSGAEISPWKEAAEPQKLFDTFEFFDEAVHLATFMQQANLLLMQLRGRGTTASAISARLEKDGFLEMREYEGKRGRLPTEKGMALGISSRMEESADGSTFMRNYYDKNAQVHLLACVKKVYEET